MAKRKLDIVVLSDIHLGTYGCHAKELNRYLKSIDPKVLILNGDIIDIWQFKKRYWPDAHMKIVQRITKMIAKGSTIYYLTGNHDEMLRRFTDFQINNFHLLNKLVLEVEGKKMWFFHGDVFDVTMKHSKWLAKLGGWGYDLLIVINGMVNWLSEKVLNKGKLSLSKKIKNSVKQAVKFIDDFEQTAIELAIDNQYDFVICGHIHQPVIREYSNDSGKVLYLNSGDWIENLTALEYQNKEWKIFKYLESNLKLDDPEDSVEEDENDYRKLPKMQHIYEDIIRDTGNGKRPH